MSTIQTYLAWLKEKCLKRGCPICGRHYEHTHILTSGGGGHVSTCLDCKGTGLRYLLDVREPCKDWHSIGTDPDRPRLTCAEAGCLGFKVTENVWKWITEAEKICIRVHSLYYSVWQGEEHF